MSRACKIENQASRCDVQSRIKRHADHVSCKNPLPPRGVLRYISDMDVQSPFLGLKFAI